MEQRLNKLLIKLLVGDVLDQAVHAIVHPISPTLSMEEAASRALLTRAGDGLLAQIQAAGGAEESDIFLTNAGNLLAHHIIHVMVPPIKNRENGRGILSRAVWVALRMAEEQHFSSLAFPLLAPLQSYPAEASASIMAQKIIDFTFEDLQALQNVSVCLPSNDVYNAFRPIFEQEISIARDESGG